MATFSLQVQPENAAEWTDTARRAEAAGFAALYVPDHPGSCAAPHVALAAAAAVTSTIKLSAYVVNAGVREPMLLAADVATLDVVSGGRAVLGIGAGHTPAEWAAVGRTRPDVKGRIDHCIAVIDATRALLAGGEVNGSRLTQPRPVQEPIPLLIGGGNTRLLRWAAEHADIIGLGGMGRTLPDGHRHEVRWRAHEIDAQIDLVRGRTLEALVQYVAITDDAGAELATAFGDVDLTEAELQAAPYVLVGTADEIVAKVRENERRWGITRYAVRRPALDLLGPLLPRMS
ncbi:MAG TPA: LLM class flavin-dependent oxidoreductase [Actinoplanes sp.]|jgi:probable F420-dependent oxidoreductase